MKTSSSIKRELQGLFLNIVLLAVVFIVSGFFVLNVLAVEPFCGNAVCDRPSEDEMSCSVDCGSLPTDRDGDGIADNVDNCPMTANGGQQDNDGDGIGDVCDNCLDVANGDQADADVNGTGDVCEEPVGPDTTGPSINFIDPSPANGMWKNDNDPIIYISSNESLSAAYIEFILSNAGFEDGATGFTTGGNTGWDSDYSVYVEGSKSIKSSGYGSYDNISNFIERTVTLVEDGEISFWWKADTEEDKDVFTFSVDGTDKEVLSGLDTASMPKFSLSAGTHTLRWTYSKDASGSAGSDTVWLDNIELKEGSTGEGITMTEGDTVKEAYYQTTDVVDGVYEYRVSVYDKAGNKTVSADRNLNIDTTAPSTIYNFEVSPQYSNKEISGKVNISATTFDNGSYVKDACLWLGDEEENLFQSDYDACKNLNERDSNSYDYMPAFNFANWDTTEVADGTYPLYIHYTDNAGNESQKSLTVKIHNTTEGAQGNPSKVSTCEEFQSIQDNVNWYYEVINDIDCSDTVNWNGGRGFYPIPSFVGVFDGQNYTINNLFMNATEQRGYSDHGGVFDDNNGVIKNINFRDVNISAEGYMGGLTNQNSGTIERVSMTGIVNCGYQQCGVLSGKGSGTISESWVDVQLSASNYTGMISGNPNGKIENCYAKGTLIGGSQSGGLSGLSQGPVTDSYATIKMTTSPADWNPNGGLIGWQYGGNQSDSYWNKELSGYDNMCGQNGTNCLDKNGLTDVQMKTKESFEGWDFDNIWAIDANKNDGYPYLQWQTSFTDSSDTDPITDDEEDTNETPTPAVRSGGGGRLMKTATVSTSESTKDEQEEETEPETGTQNESAGEVRGARRH